MNSSRIFAPARFVTALLSIALVMAGVSGCGGSDEGGNSPPAIGAAGGTVAGPNGAQVIVPPGALAADTAIAVDQSSSGSPALPSGMSTFGSMYAFTSHGTSFAVPVTVTVPFAAASLPAGATPVLYKTNAAGVWERVTAATVTAATISAQVTGFSWMIVGNLPPQINTHPADVTVAQPATASFSVAALGTPPLSYRWQRSDDAGATFVDIVGATANSYTTGATSVAADSGDRYRVLVSNIEGVSTSNAATLTVTSAPPMPVAGARIAGGNGWSLARRANGQMLSWGSDSGEALGNEAVGSRNIPGPVASVADDAINIGTGSGSVHGLSVRANGEVWGWGYNMFGQLGINNTGLFARPSAMKDAGNNTVANALAVAAGVLHSLVLRGDGIVLATGFNANGQLGDGTTTGRTHAAPVPGLNNVTAIAAGGSFSLALRSDGTVWAWGANSQGQLGDGSFSDRNVPVQISGLTGITAIAAGIDFALALQSNGDVWAWGRNDNNQLGDASGVANRNMPGRVTIAGVSAIAAGAQHGIAILAANGSLNAWGFNQFGQLGVGDGVNRIVPTLVAGLPAIVAIAGGQNHTLTVDGAGNVWAWGRNGDGELGLGSATASFNTPQQVPGLNLN